MTRTSVEDDWSSPTHYHGGRAVEPRLFTEADPLAGVFVGEPADGTGRPDARAEGVWGTDVWSATTYVGKARRRHRRPAPVPASKVDDGPAAASDPGVADATVDAAVREVLESHPTEVDATHEPAAAPSTAPSTEPAVADRGLMANSRTMAIASLASRITGFVRSVMLVAALGAGAVGNAYNSGNNLPNMIYELLLGGVLSSVLIPLLVKAEDEDADRGLAYTQRLLSIATAALAVMTVAVVALAPWIAAVFVPAGPQRELTSIFATLLLPEIFFYGLGAMIMAVLNIKHVYGPGAWSPLLNNVVVMATVLIFWTLPGPKTLDPSSMTTPQVLVIGIGTTLGIAAQALVLIPSLRRTGFSWAWRFRARAGEKDRLREIGTLAGWVLGYVVVSQLGVSVIQKVGNDNGGFSVFTNVDLLFQMPYGILVVSVLTAIMPRLSRSAVREDTAAVVADLSLGARLSAVALVPITAALIVLGPVFGTTLFALGANPPAKAALMGSALAWSAFGLFPFALVMLQLRVFYAMRDGRTPTIINAFMVGTKIVLVLVTSAAFAAPKGTNVNLHPSVPAVEWLNISTSLSYVVGAVAGHILLTRRLGHLGFRRVARTVGQIAVPSVVGAAIAWGLVQGAYAVVGHGRAGAATGLVVGGVVGLVVMGGLAWRMRIPDVQEAVQLSRR